MALAAAATGCAGLPLCATKAQYVVVERQVSAAEGIAQTAQVTPTPAYLALRANFKTVAIRMPDNCYDAQLHGVSGNQETAELQTNAAFHCKRSERALTEGGYQVLSWTTLMGLERQQNVPVHVAAQQLGADIVIILNDSGATYADAGASVNGKNRFSFRTRSASASSRSIIHRRQDLASDLHPAARRRSARARRPFASGAPQRDRRARERSRERERSSGVRDGKAGRNRAGKDALRQAAAAAATTPARPGAERRSDLVLQSTVGKRRPESKVDAVPVRRNAHESVPRSVPREASDR